jgi:AraC-like DNA-binding protein
MAAAHSTRLCWHAPELADAVMFHGRYNHEFMPHAHDEATLIVVTGGRVAIDIDGITHQVCKGQMVAIGAHQVHAARPLDHDGWKMRSLHLPPGLLESLLPDSGGQYLHFARPVQNGSAISALLFDLHYCSQIGGPLEQRGKRFAEFLRRFADQLEVFAPHRICTQRRDAQLTQAQQMLAHDFLSNTSLDSIAKAVGLSTFALIRRFKRLNGISPHAWRMQARANLAARLLRDQADLADVSSYCGFADQAHMTRVFKRVFGVTPGQYGAMNRLAI